MVVKKTSWMDNIQITQEQQVGGWMGLLVCPSSACSSSCDHSAFLSNPSPSPQATILRYAPIVGPIIGSAFIIGLYMAARLVRGDLTDRMAMVNQVRGLGVGGVGGTVGSSLPPRPFPSPYTTRPLPDTCVQEDDKKKRTALKEARIAFLEEEVPALVAKGASIGVDRTGCGVLVVSEKPRGRRLHSSSHPQLLC